MKVFYASFLRLIQEYFDGVWWKPCSGCTGSCACCPSPQEAHRNHCFIFNIHGKLPSFFIASEPETNAFNLFFFIITFMPHKSCVLFWTCCFQHVIPVLYKSKTYFVCLIIKPWFKEASARTFFMFFCSSHKSKLNLNPGWNSMLPIGLKEKNSSKLPK